jgi:hypothetical protein
MLTRLKLLEIVRFDSSAAAVLLFSFYYAIILFARMKGDNLRILSFAGRIFRHVNTEWARRYATHVLLKSINKNDLKQVARDCHILSNTSEKVAQRLSMSIREANRPFDERLLILSAPSGSRKGVMLIKFTQYFPYLPVVFDMESLGKDYVLVLEPSGAGYFDECLLCLMAEKAVFLVQASEPVDQDFLQSINTYFFIIDLGANCWVDPRKFHPIEEINKEYDIAMVSIWSSFKRHYRLFEALSQNISKQKRKIALIGKPYPWSIDRIKEMARYYGVDDSVHYFEGTTQDQVNIILNKSKVHLLLSKKEGFNKATIEAMYANVPSFLIEGHNFGHRYFFINKKTGGFIHDSHLAQFIDTIDDMLVDNNFSPREWVIENMSPHLSTQKLIDMLSYVEKEKGIMINKDLRVKVNNPNCDYYDQESWGELAVYYRDLQKYLKA